MKDYAGLYLDLARKLKKLGYEIADCHGERVNKVKYLDKNGVGILRNKKNLLRGDYIGNIWVDYEELKAKPNKQWVLEVYGKENLVELTHFFKKISKAYKVKLEVILESEETLKEEYM